MRSDLLVIIRDGRIDGILDGCQIRSGKDFHGHTIDAQIGINSGRRRKRDPGHIRNALQHVDLIECGI